MVIAVMSTPEKPAAPDSGRLGRGRKSPARVCRVCRALAGCWALASAAAGLFAFLCTTMPVRRPVADSLLPTGPAWIPAGIFSLMVLGNLLVTFSMPLLVLPLLAAGFLHLRRHVRRRWAVAWAAALAAAFALEVAYLTNFAGPSTSIYYVGPAVPDWAHLAETAMFLALGALMIHILAAAYRESGRRLSSQ